MALRSDDIQFLQYEDDLTGFYNRRWLLRQLQTEVPWNAPAGPVSIGLLDLDGFAEINERLGHSTGDDVLIQVGQRIKAKLRKEDAVGRYGGDSFLVILPGLDKDAAIALLEGIRSDLALAAVQPPVPDAPPVAVSFSGGVATFPDDARTAEDLIEGANRAIYVAKKSGKNVTAAVGRIDAAIAAERDTFSTLPCPRFVGRDEELKAAMAAVAELAEKRPTLLLVQGPAGAGKSRFLRELAARTQPSGLLYLQVSCMESKRLIPAYALLYLIDRYYEKHPDAHDHLKSKLSAHQRAVLRDTITAFLPWKAEVSQPSQRDRRVVALQAVEASIRAMAEKAPLLILLDNVGDVDRGTLDVLRTIIRDGRTPIGVVLAFKGDVRSLDPRRDGALIDFIAEFEKAQLNRTVTLGPLATADLEAMVRSILPGAELPADFAGMIAGASQGNPLYVEETIRALMLSGKIRRGRDAWTLQPVGPAELPASLDDVIRSVLNTLPKGMSEILTNASVIGPQFDVQVLQDVMGRKEAQTLDAVDRSRETGLLRKTQDGPVDDFEFASGHTRAVQYASADELTKRTTHRRLADVLKVRALNQPEAAGEVEFHELTAAGENPFPPDTPAEAVRPARIPEATAALPPEGLKRAVEVMRSLTALLKIGKLYPQWNQTSEGFKTALVSALEALLAGAPVATFSIGPQGLKVNAQPVEASRGSDAPAEFQDLMGRRLMESVTLQQGLEPREIDALVAALAAPMNRSTTPRDHWDAFLARERMAHVDIVQRRFLAKEGDSVRIKRGGVVEERALTAEELGLLWPAVRFIKAAIDNLRMYPPGHALVEAAMADAVTAFETLMQRAPVVTLAVQERALIVNGAAADPQAAADAAAFLVEELARRELKSLTLSAGVGGDEIRALVSALSTPDVKMSGAILGDPDIRHIAVNIRNYTKIVSGSADAGAAEAAAGPAAVQAAAPASGPEPKMRLDLRARAWLKAPVDRFVNELSEGELIMVVEALNFGTFVSLANELMDRYGLALTEANPEWRRRAALKISKLFAEAPAPLRASLMARLRRPLQAAVAAERDPDVLYVLGQASMAWLAQAFAASQLQDVAEFLAVLKPKLDRADVSKDFKALMAPKVQALIGSAARNPALDALKGPDLALRPAAVQILAMAGAALVPAMIDLVSTSESAETRTAAAAVLKLAGGAAPLELARGIRADAFPGPVIRILGVIETTGINNIVTPVFAALDHKDPSVREAVFALIRRIDRNTAIAILRKMLAKEDPALIVTVLSAAGQMKIGDLAADVARQLLGGRDETLLQAACQYLIRYPTPSALDALWKIFDEKGKMFGLVKGLSDETRAAAVAVATRIKHQDAQELVAEALEDRSPVVRAAAGSAKS